MPNESKNSFKFGRGHESDLRINDISVSRCHAIIKFKVDQPTTEGTANRFYLEDNLSKFGTLVLIRRRTPLIPGFNKAVQIGRTVINFSVKAISSGSNSGGTATGLQGLVKGKIEEANQILNAASHKVQMMNEDGKLNNDDDEDMDEGLDGGQDHFEGKLNEDGLL